MTEVTEQVQPPGAIEHLQMFLDALGDEDQLLAVAATAEAYLRGYREASAPGPAEGFRDGLEYAMELIGQTLEQVYEQGVLPAIPEDAPQRQLVTHLDEAVPSSGFVRVDDDGNVVDMSPDEVEAELHAAIAAATAQNGRTFRRIEVEGDDA